MSDWLTTKKGKRKRSLEQQPQQQQEDAVVVDSSQDVLGMKPLKRVRRNRTELSLQTAAAAAADEESPSAVATFREAADDNEGAAAAAALSDQSRVRSALHPDECEELLHFIERNYLSSLSALMYSLKDLLFAPEPADSSASAAAEVQSFAAEFNRLRQMKDGIVKRAAVTALKKQLQLHSSAGSSSSSSAPGTPVRARRRQLSPFYIFQKEHARRVREEHPDLPFGERSTLVAAKWKSMSDEEKAPYVQKAAEEAETSVAADEPSSCTYKRAITAWQVFFGEQTAERKSAGLSRQELARSISEDWRQLSAADRAKYAALADERTSQPPTPRQTKQMAPGWTVFRKEQGKILREENPDITAADRLKELHAQWDALTDEQRAEYREMAESARAATGIRKKLLSNNNNNSDNNSNTTARSRSSTHVSSGVIAEDEGAVVVRSKRLNANAFLSLTRIPTVVLVDITLKSTSQYRKFAYAYPVGGVPLPLGRKEAFAMSVEGIYEGLKVFEKAGVDRSMLTNQTMKSLHRTEKKNGRLLGWSRGLKGHSDGDMLLNEKEARWQILFPAYKFVLDECLQDEVSELRVMIKKGSQLVLLDMENNVDVYDYSRPVAAAELLRRYLLDQWPTSDEELRQMKEAAEQVGTKVVPKTVDAPSKKGYVKKSLPKQNKEPVQQPKEVHEDSEKVHWDSQISLGEEEAEGERESAEDEDSDEDPETCSEEDSSVEDQSEEDHVDDEDNSSSSDNEDEDSSD